MGSPRLIPLRNAPTLFSRLRPRAQHCSPLIKHAGFSLVEILVVIVIIAILAALILPALAGVQRSSRAVTSLGNLRQWGVGFAASVGENNNEMPSDGGAEFKIDDPTAWFNRLPPKIKVAPLKDSQDDLPKIGVKSLWINPEVPNTAVQGVPFCYGFNDYLSTTAEPNMRVTQIMYPSKTVLMAEKTPDTAPKVTPDSLKPYFGSKDPNDNDAICNILFVDGHAEGVKRLVFAQPTATTGATEEALRVAPFTWLPFPDAQR